jgi:hypothetical protein
MHFLPTKFCTSVVRESALLEQSVRHFVRSGSQDSLPLFLTRDMIQKFHDSYSSGRGKWKPQDLSVGHRIGCGLCFDREHF